MTGASGDGTGRGAVQVVYHKSDGEVYRKVQAMLPQTQILEIHLDKNRTLTKQTHRDADVC